MCCLFGISDYKGILTPIQKKRLLKTLAVCCEARGTDATGIAYNTASNMKVVKKPVAAHKLKFRIPWDTKVVMGHTRLTTQGNEKFNYNNHPWIGTCKETSFALAHNGVLQNDGILRRERELPTTKIETDSYIAVQLIENQEAFSVLAIQKMAEAVEGSFCFTLLDQGNNLYIVKGDNPMTVLHFKHLGFYIYASTEEILMRSVHLSGFGKYFYENIPISMGDILKIKGTGTLERYTFDTEKLTAFDYGWYHDRGYRGCSRGWNIQEPKKKAHKERRTYLELLIAYAGNLGICEEEIQLLVDYGFQEVEIEDLLYDPQMFQCCVEELLEQEQYVY